MVTNGNSDISYIRFLTLFCVELANIKFHIDDFTIERYLNQESETNDRNRQCSLISARLKGVLMQQEATVDKYGTQEEKRWYRLVQYSLVAYADEVFLFELNWGVWSGNLLEKSLFRTAMAGRNMFDFIERAIESGDTSLLHRDVAAVYLSILHLGFQGRFRGVNGKVQIERFKLKLHELIGQPVESEHLPPIFPDAYTTSRGHHDLDRPKPTAKFAKIWWRAAIIYVAVSIGVWFFLVQQVENVIDADDESAQQSEVRTGRGLV